jgi:hypothetical protein
MAESNSRGQLEHLRSCWSSYFQQRDPDLALQKRTLAKAYVPTGRGNTSKKRKGRFMQRYLQLGGAYNSDEESGAARRGKIGYLRNDRIQVFIPSLTGVPTPEHMLRPWGARRTDNFTVLVRVARSNIK